MHQMLGRHALQLNMWIVLVALGCYQLYLQWHLRGGEGFKEGFIKNLQVLTGIPALVFLGVYLIDPTEIGYVFVHIPHLLRLVGLVLFNGAGLLIVWSHVTLGRFWSGDLETRADHRVIDTGPYHYVRHPLYASYLYMTLGLFLMTGNWLVGGSMLLYFTAVAARCGKEEEMLLSRLGAPYAHYMRRTNRFIFGKVR